MISSHSSRSNGVSKSTTRKSKRRGRARVPARSRRFSAAEHARALSLIVAGMERQQVADTIGLYREPIPQEFWNELRHAGLVRPDAPLPGVA